MPRRNIEYYNQFKGDIFKAVDAIQYNQDNKGAINQALRFRKLLECSECGEKYTTRKLNEHRAKCKKVHICKYCSLPQNKFGWKNHEKRCS